MRALGEPADVSFTPGNHDAYVRDAMEGLAETFAPWTSGDAGADGPDRFPFLRVRRDVALIGLNSGVPTAPLMATGRLGARQIAELGDLLQETGARGLARVILIHHPPLSRGGSPLRGLTDARALEDDRRPFRRRGDPARPRAQADGSSSPVARLAHRGRTHPHSRRPIRHRPRRADPRQRAAYHLIRLERAGEFWRVGATRARPAAGARRDRRARGAGDLGSVAS